MALFGPHAMSELSPLSGAKRKLDFGAIRAAFDPKATSPLRHAGHQHPIADTFASGTKRGIGA